MSSSDTGNNNSSAGGDLVLASDGGRNLPMEYDDVKFTDKDCQLADKDSYQSNTERHQQGIPRFDLGEHIDVQLGFDTLEDSVLLQDQGQREEAWGSHFSREENGVLGLEAVSQNIEFSSTTSETCTRLRHINVWSEATSSESVQMLLNSVGEDEGKLVERSDTQEPLQSSNGVEFNVPKTDCLPPNVGAVLEVKCERSTKIDQQGSKTSAMDVRDNNQEVQTSSEPDPDNRIEQGNSASRPEDEECLPMKDDASEKYKMEAQGEKLYSASGQQTTIIASLQQTHADFGQVKLQEKSNPTLGECDKGTGGCAMEASQQDAYLSEIQGSSLMQDEGKNENTGKDATLKETITVNKQGGSGSLVDEHNENNKVICPTQTSQEPVVSSEVQVTLKLLPEKKTEDVAVSFHADFTPGDVGGTSEVVSDTISDEKQLKPAADTVVKDDKSVEMEVESNQENTEKDVAGVSHENVVADSILEKVIEHDRGKHVIEVSNDDVLVSCSDEKSKIEVEQGIPGSDKQLLETSILFQEKGNNESIVVENSTSVKMEVLADPLQGNNIKSEDKHVLGIPHENVLEGMQVNRANVHVEVKHVNDTFEKDVLLVCDDETFKCEGEQGMPGSDNQSSQSSIILQEKAKEQKDNSLKTEEMSLSGENAAIASCSILTDTDPEAGKDGGSRDMIRQAETDCQVKDLKAELTSSRHENSPSLPSADAAAGAPVVNEAVSSMSQDSPGFKLNVQMVITTATDHNNDNTSQVIKCLVAEPTSFTTATDHKNDNASQVIKCLVAEPTSSQDDHIQNVLSAPLEKLVHDGLGSLAGDVAEKCVLEASSFSTPKKSANMHESGNQESYTIEAGENHENEMKNMLVKSVPTAVDSETMDGSIDSPKGKSILPVFHTETETDEHMAGAVSVQDSKESTLPVQEAMTGIFQKPLQIHDSYATSEATPTKQIDQMNQDLEKGLKEASMLHMSRAQDDGNTETGLEANCLSTQNDSVIVQKCDVSSLEVGVQNQENEKKHNTVEIVLTARENAIMEEVTDSPARQEIPHLSHTEAKTGEYNSGDVRVQDIKEVTMTTKQAMTGRCEESLKLNDAWTTPEADHDKQTDQGNEEFEEGAKEVHMSFGSEVRDNGGTKTALSSDEQQCLSISESGDSGQQTLQKVSPFEISERKDFEKVKKGKQHEISPSIALPLKQTEDCENDIDMPEAMEVSLEVGISVEPDNDSPARDGDGNNLQGSLPSPIDRKGSAENTDLAFSGKLTSNSKDGVDKVDRVGTATGDLEGESVSQTDDTFKFEVGTKNANPKGDAVASVNFPMSRQMDKDVGCAKPFQAIQPSEVRKNNSSAVCQTEDVQAKENVNDHVSRKSAVSVMDSLVQEGNIGSSEGKAKSVPIGEKISQTTVNGQVTSLSTVSIGKGNHPSNVSTRQESKSSCTGTTAKCTQPTPSSAVQTSTLPDLNATVTPASVMFQQPFTDSQQVQLRAQILVYGSLIQGSLPDEALMLTAFADIGASQIDTTLSDGGRSLWEGAWHTAADRIHRKTFSNTSEVPIHTPGSATPATVSNKIVEGMKTPSPSAIVNVTDSRNSPVLGLRSADLAASKSHSLQNKAVITPSIARSGNKNTPSGIMSPPRPVTLSSPVWGMSTPVNEGMHGSNVPRSLHIDPQQMSAARHLYHAPHLGHYPSPVNSNPWLSPLHFPGPWLSPPQGTLPESGIPFSSFLVPEVTQETLHNRRTPPSSVPHTPMTHAIPHFPGMAVPSTGHSINAITDASKGAVGVSKQSSSEQKSRKRKKKSVLEDVTPTGSLKSSGALASVTAVAKCPPSSTPVSSHGPPMTVITSSNAPFATGTSIQNMPSVSNYQVISRGETGQRVIFSEETASRIEQAKLNAEEAASIAASAVRHSQGIWRELANQRSSGIVSECEAKLASAAVAAAAAASVAKAAAAAAKVASDAAVQAKLMATEALNSDGKTDASHSTEGRFLEGNQGNSHSLISAARETAKKRVEAASAATKRAENLDAVVRAAELAAQAVTQAGAVVAMGDPVPLTLSALLEAGPEAYWKLVTEQKGTQKDQNVHSEPPLLEIVSASVENNIKLPKSKNRRDALKKQTSRNVEEGMRSSSAEVLKLVEKGCKLTPAVAALDIVSTENDSVAQKENQVAGIGQTALAISDAEAVSREATTAPETEHMTESYRITPAPKANEIKEGSFVEVVSDEEGLRGVWFSAKVLSLKDGKAFVRYDELLSDEGPGQLQEWIPLEGENGKAPRIRVAHPMTVMKFEGTRKRRRAAMGSYVWSVGDRVDAWIRDGWWEGIITDKKDDDESKLTVHFPGEGDTSIIKAWNLRPSLIWKDGQWVEWTYLKTEKEGTHEDELPSEKRQKLDKHDTDGETKCEEKLQKIPNLEEAKKIQDLNAVMSSGKDKSLGVVKNSIDDGSSAGLRVNQLGLQRGGSKVVFGVPKPTKKRKFMDVSKHYVADRMTKNSSDAKFSGKFDKHKAPVSHIGLKGPDKLEDKKSRRPMISKPKDLKFGRGYDVQSKTKPERDKNSAVNSTVTKETPGQELNQSAMPSFAIDGNKGGRRIGLGGNALSIKSGEALHPSVPKEGMTHMPSPSNRLKDPSLSESEQGSKGKQSSASDSSALYVEKAASRLEVVKDKFLEKATVDTMEPRRSNRKIQPTSRLLEGLQTSPFIVKGSFGFSSHEKGGKVQSKASSSIPKGNING